MGKPGDRRGDLSAPAHAVDMIIADEDRPSRTRVSDFVGMEPLRENADRHRKDVVMVRLFSVLTSEQIRLPKVDGWRKIAIVVRQTTPRAA